MGLSPSVRFNWARSERVVSRALTYSSATPAGDAQLHTAHTAHISHICRHVNNNHYNIEAAETKYSCPTLRLFASHQQFALDVSQKQTLIAGSHSQNNYHYTIQLSAHSHKTAYNFGQRMRRTGCRTLKTSVLLLFGFFPVFVMSTVYSILLLSFSS